MTFSQDLAAICRFLRQQHVLTLCASSGEDVWCANCFYVFDESGMSLYVMTQADTRHGALMVQNPRVVGTIAHQTRTVALIKGIQYRARAECLEGEAMEQAYALYCHHFPVARAVKAPLWALRLDEIKMTDNKLGFGKKRLWLREGS